MKNIKYILLSFLAIGLVACDGNDLDFDTTAEIDHTGGLISVDKALISYVVGEDGTYTFSGSVLQADVATSSIELYKSFTDVDGNTSETIPFKTVSLTTDSQTELFSTTASYAELKEGLSVNGAALPDSDTELNIGDFWTISYRAITENGDESLSRTSTKVAVGTRFAGVYKVIASSYYRIGEDNGNWNGEERIIESVDATVYKHIGVGPWDDVPAAFGYPIEQGQVFFTVDNDTDVVSYADIGNSVIVAQPFITCASNPGSMTNANCATSNIVIKDDVEGKDIIYLSYGYLTPGSGPREFYEVLEKVVN